MKTIVTNGITYLEKFDTTMEWYWGTDYSCGDLYEAEDVFLAGKKFDPNRLIFVHYPDGKVFEPVKAKENQYFASPACIEGIIYILLVNFDERMIYVIQCSHNMQELSTLVKIPLSAVRDFYNLKIDGSPIMLTRQGGNNHFQVIWPKKVDFDIDERESFLFRKDNKLFFSKWHEDPVYREEINIREYPSGNLLEKLPGSIMTLPDNQNWILR